MKNVLMKFLGDIYIWLNLISYLCPVSAGYFQHTFIAEANPHDSVDDFINSIEGEMKKILEDYRNESESINAEINSLINLYQIKIKQIKNEEALQSDSKVSGSGQDLKLKRETKQKLSRIIESRNRVRNKAKGRFEKLKQKLLPYPSLSEKIQSSFLSDEGTHTEDAMISAASRLICE